jgi:general secretion pathway protein M
MNPTTALVQTFQAFWRQRTAQEQRTLRIAALALSLLLAYQLIWSPIQQAAKSATAQLDSTQKLAAFTQDAKQTLMRAAAPAKPSQTQSVTLMVWVEQAARSMGIEPQLTQRQPVTNGADGLERVQLKFSAVPFDPLLRWLAQANSAGFGVVQLEITAQPGSKTGLVDASIQLGRRGGA